MTITTDNVVFGHTSMDTAREVGDYPYGYTRRTTIRYWIETDPRHGDRFVSQTLNPNTARWNKPKASTYMPVMAMYVNEEGHVTHTGLGQWADDAVIEVFRAAVPDERLNELQRKQLARLIGLKRVFDKVTFVVVDVGAQTAEDRARQADTERRISAAVRHEATKVLRDFE